MHPGCPFVASLHKVAMPGGRTNQPDLAELQVNEVLQVHVEHPGSPKVALLQEILAPFRMQWLVSVVAVHVKALLI